jgi:uncharacterized integral membrane protein
MRQINFVVIFVICLALVLFGIENTEFSIIHVVPGIDLSAPLSVELLISAGIGAVLAWIFSVWTGLQSRLNMQPEVKQRDGRIQELEQDVERYKVELEEQQRLLPASEPRPQDVEVTEVIAK